ncbi:MAG TPA: class II aldolase/adducin family protein [Jiangellaceae bacterium]|nr:class II aldolase/adducin family protein [Jiangellaceae bacterium]
MDDATAAELVALGRRVVAAGLVVASGGNLAVRLGAQDRLLVTPQGWALDDLDPAALVTVGLDGHHICGAYAPTTELALHLAAFKARSDAVVCLHLHPPLATLLHAAGLPIRRITTDHAYYLRRLAVLPFIQPGSDRLAQAVAAELAGADIVMLGHHGCVIIANSFDVGFSRAANLEAAAVATYRARVLGLDVADCPPEFLAEIAAQEAAGVIYGRDAGSGSAGAPPS